MHLEFVSKLRSNLSPMQNWLIKYFSFVLKLNYLRYEPVFDWIKKKIKIENLKLDLKFIMNKLYLIKKMIEKGN